MAQVVADKRDIDFNLFEMMRCQDMAKHTRYRDFDQKSFDMVVSEARKFGLKEILPTYAEGDRQGVGFDNGAVTVPECFRRPFKLFAGEWTSMAEDLDVGGQGLPHMVAQAASEYLSGANISLTTYAIQGHGVGKMIQLFGTEKQRELFLRNLYTAKWTGSMQLTEPEAGSDVGALTTTAKKNDDGTYSITGNKIFISVGEHDLADNIIHAVLARVEGAAEGTRGLSLFIVPKYWVNDDGSLGERNDVVCSGIEEKMGIHGMVTCSFALGAKGTCRGLLLGEENMGMKIMFHMMNEERLIVGAQAFGNASCAYLHALNYARERIQGKDMDAARDPASPKVPIIRHPDVRRMLLWMKAYVEGMRSFIYHVAGCFDGSACAASQQEKTAYDEMIALFTPLVKAYCSDRGFEVCAGAVQVFGGYGYIRDYPVEQLLRDVKVVSLYEGANGIQAMDLLGRKIGMRDGAVFKRFIEQVKACARTAEQTSALKPLAVRLAQAADRLEALAGSLAAEARSANFKIAYAHATPFLEVMGDVIMAWMLLWRASAAAKAMGANGKSKDQAFYDGQIKTATFFVQTILPVTLGKMDAIEERSTSTIDISEKSFGA